jgi:hypothetical protein
MSLLLKLAGFALCAYLAILLAAYLGQRRLMYFPDRSRTLPTEAGLHEVEERVIDTPDGARVVAWYGKAHPGQPTILYFHGNADSLAARAPRIERFMAEGWGVFMLSYRGYSGGTGSPSEAANVADPPMDRRSSLRPSHGRRPERWSIWPSRSFPTLRGTSRT